MNAELDMERSSYALIEILPRYFREGPEEYHENAIQGGRYPGRDSSQPPTGDKSRAYRCVNMLRQIYF
jgi:hypothetical protein